MEGLYRENERIVRHMGQLPVGRGRPLLVQPVKHLVAQRARDADRHLVFLAGAKRLQIDILLVRRLIHVGAGFVSAGRVGGGALDRDLYAVFTHAEVGLRFSSFECEALPVQELADLELEGAGVEARGLELLDEVSVLLDQADESVVHQPARRLVAGRRLHQLKRRVQQLLRNHRVKQSPLICHRNHSTRYVSPPI